MDPTAERVARNNATFRDANDRIETAAQRADIELVPFICECADVRCTDLVRITLEDYGHVRSSPVTFLNVPGHQKSAQGWAQVVEEHEGWVMVEKVGEAAELVLELTPEQQEEETRG